MKPARFIASGLRFKGVLAIVAIALSFFVIILALAISGGFRTEIRKAVSSMTGDVQLAATFEPVRDSLSYLPEIAAMPFVTGMTPVIYRPGIVKGDDDIQGVVLKGVPSPDSLQLTASIPSCLSRSLRLGPGDRMTVYFIGEKVQVRKFRVREVYDNPVETGGKASVIVPLKDLQRLNGWKDSEVSSIELTLKDSDPASVRMRASEIGSFIILNAKEDEDVLLATSVQDKYPQLFDWLALIDFNVTAILLLMILVAGFNMISGLLILLFRHVSTIGILKAMGMTDKDISKVFLNVSSRIVLIGMAIGNGLGLLFCLIQGTTQLIKLNPANYFVSFVPVSLNIPVIVIAELIAYGAIMLMLLLPSLFISRVDPAETVRTR